MFVHVHTYYSNLFEPGLLFPETINLSFDNQFSGVALGALKFTPVELEGASLDADTSAYKLAEESKFTIPMSFGYLGLVYLGAPEDFNLEELMAANTAVKVSNMVFIELDKNTLLEASDIDFELTLASEGSVNVSSSSVDTNFIVAPGSGLLININ